MPEWGACLLGSINLSEFVKNPFTYIADINWSDLANTVYIATKALNDVQEEGIPMHPLKEQQECAERWKQIGLGVFGVADMLIKLGIKYDSDEGIKLCGKIANFIFNNAAKESALLAKSRGAYADFNYDEVSTTDFYLSNVYPEVDGYIKKYGLRNSQLLTIAPTGTLSTMFGVSGGVEPIFANSYTRTTKSLHGDKDVDYKIYTPIVKKYMDEHNLTDESQLPDYFVTANTIDPIKRVHIQSAWQDAIDASISSTVNLPHEATIEDIENIYMEAWEFGLKGITVFRDGCSRVAILNNKSTDTEKRSDESSSIETLERGTIITVSDDLIGKKRKLQTGCGSLHCSAFFDPVTGDLMETYLSKGSTGGCDHTLTGLSRMISLAARAGCDIHDIVDQLNSTGACASYAVRRAVHKDTSKGACCPMAVGNAILDMYNEMQNEITCDEDVEEVTEFYAEDTKIVETVFKRPTETCPECGEELIFEGGCCLCKSCGYSRCS